MKNRLFIINVCFLFCLICLPTDVCGFSYETYSNGYFTSIHVLTVDPNEHAICPVKANGESFSRETVKNLADQYGAEAAINGGFWKLNGNPAGILKINHQWYGTPIKPRGAIGWSDNGKQVIIDKVLTNYPLDLCPEDCVIEVIPASNPSHTTSDQWQGMENIVGGTPVLVCGGNVVEDFSSEQTLESFLVNPHPRTAVGIRENGDWVFVVVDGRFFSLFGGMIMKELAELMLELGCIEALNLDGGSSSTLVIEGVVINEPAGTIQEEGKRVEAVSDAILIFPFHYTHIE